MYRKEYSKRNNDNKNEPLKIIYMYIIAETEEHR